MYPHNNLVMSLCVCVCVSERECVCVFVWVYVCKIYIYIVWVYVCKIYIYIRNTYTCSGVAENKISSKRTWRCNSMPAAWRACVMFPFSVVSLFEKVSSAVRQTFKQLTHFPKKKDNSRTNFKYLSRTQIFRTHICHKFIDLSCAF